MFHNRCIHQMSRSRCNKIDDLVLACPNNSSGLRPRLAARPRPRLHSKDKHIQNIENKNVQINNTYNPRSKIRPEVTTILKTNHCIFYDKNIQKTLQNTSKRHLKVTQNHSFLEPGSHLGTMVPPGSLIAH